MLRYAGALLVTLSAFAPSAAAYNSSNFSPNIEALQAQQLFALADRPPECPPCFNCLLPDFACKNFGHCNNRNGRCDCPPGFAGEDCLQPLCGSLPGGEHRPPKGKDPCECDDGWGGINCNVCQEDHACDVLMPEGEQGVCYKQGITVKRNFQQCNVTNRKILEMLKRNPQVTFSCNKEDEECNFQFWVDQRESFYCGLTDCSWELQSDDVRNVTNYVCKDVKCECIPGRTLCGEGGTIDLGDFLDQEITGPATFSCDSSKNKDQCMFSEPNMNQIITSIFGDETILLDCNSGECLHRSEVPGYKKPIKTINKPLIAGIIAASALFLVAVVLGLWYMGRRAAQKAGLGPIHLPDEDDEALKILTEHKPASLQFRGLSYELNGKKILEGVQGVVNPGEVMAIMGPSGAGKTTFLDILARKNKRGTIGGDIFVNGEKQTDEDFKEIIGFVDQEDTLMPTLTVYETILNSALLRLPGDMNFQAKHRRVMEVMGQLGILGIKDQMIGTSEDNGVRGISGGEKRRVGIACELVTSPSILFLDEPTSGLDSYNAYNVIECLVNLARNYRRTIVFTIHQPKSNIVALFDQLVLLARGRCVYSGAFNKVQAYFDQQGYPCPPGFNIADYLVDLTVHAEQRRAFPQDDLATADERTTADARPQPRRRGSSIRDRQASQLFTRKKTATSTINSILEDDTSLHSSDPLEPTNPWREPIALEETDALLPSAPNSADATDLDVLIQAYHSSFISRDIHDEIARAVADPTIILPNGVEGNTKSFKRLGWWGQFRILSSRTFKNLYRNPLLLLTHYAISILLAVLCGYLFYGITDDISGFQNRMGLFFFILALFGFSTLTSLHVFASERTLFLRERANGYYHPITYFSSKLLFDILPLRILPPILMGTILYPMVGLVTAWPEFSKFLLVLVLFNLAAASICLFIGILISTPALSNLIGSLVMLFSLLFAGLLLNHKSIPKAAVWCQGGSIFHYAFEALIVNEVRWLTLVEHKFGLDIEVPGATILSTFGFDSLAYWRDVAGLAGMGVGFIVLAYCAMHFLLVEKR